MQESEESCPNARISFARFLCVRCCMRGLYSFSRYIETDADHSCSDPPQILYSSQVNGSVRVLDTYIESQQP